MKQLLLFFGIVIIGAIILIAISNQGKVIEQPITAISPTPTFLPISPLPISPSAKDTVTPIVPSKNPQEQKVTKATIKTSKGNIIVSFFSDDAPKTVANFTKKSKDGFYNNLTFHRVEDWVIQGGDPKGNGTGGGDMPVEFNPKPFVIGALGVASRGDGKVQNDAQFFITKQEASWLNSKYTNFGQVTEGMEIVNKIQIGDKIQEITFR